MRKPMHKKCFLVAAGLPLLCAFVSGHAQTNPPQTTTPDASSTSAPQAQNLPTELNFTPQQAEQWRAINREFRGQEVAASLKVRQARLALADAMEASTPNEELIKQRAKDLADAQSAMTQLQALRQARVLQILTPEQRVKLKEIRERNQALRRQQLGENGLRQRQQMKNPAAPPLTRAQRKALRQQKVKP
jgi:Spy/CpxP family protein refolding chaperone